VGSSGWLDERGSIYGLRRRVAEGKEVLAAWEDGKRENVGER